MAKIGRPSILSEELAETICERLIDGKSLRTICCDQAMPSTGTICRWLANDKAFREQYERARDAQADTLADEILDIADDGSNDYMGEDEKYNGDAVARSRLRVDARKWIASKLKPKKYGDKTLLGSDPENPLPAGFIIRDVAGDGE